MAVKAVDVDQLLSVDHKVITHRTSNTVLSGYVLSAKNSAEADRFAARDYG